jgi:hypothetical protein
MYRLACRACTVSIFVVRPIARIYFALRLLVLGDSRRARPTLPNDSTQPKSAYPIFDQHQPSTSIVQPHIDLRPIEQGSS